MTYRGCVRNGVVVIEGGVTLPEGTIVTVEAQADAPASAARDPLYDIGELASPTGMSDLALNIDHYLYGHPKANDE